MKKTLLIMVAVVLWAGSAQAAPITYTTVLSGLNENPANGSAGSGFATVIIDTTANTLSVEVTFQDLSAPATAAHIHCCVAAPGNVGVATQTPTFGGFPVLVSGFYSNVFDTSLTSTFNSGFVTANGGTADGAEARLAIGLADGQAYFNIHTATFPGGEIRGFLTSTTTVPEPMTVSLLGLGLGAVGMARRKRRA